MNKDPRYMDAFIDEYDNRDSWNEWPLLRHGLRIEQADHGPVDDTGPITRLVVAIIRGDKLAALAGAEALDRHLRLYGQRLPDEPETTP